MWWTCWCGRPPRADRVLPREEVSGDPAGYAPRVVWIERVFEPDYILVRLAILLAALVGDLVWIIPGVEGRDWALALLALALAGVCRWSPPAATLIAAGLLLYGELHGFAVTPALKVLTCVLLFETAVRAPLWQVLGAAAACGFVVCWHAGSAGEVVFRVVILQGVPLLLGGYVRLAREAARRERDGAARRVEAARAAERAAIARELHDLVAHHVSSMVLRVGVARHVLAPGADPRVTEVLDDLHAAGSAALDDLRRLVGVLRAPLDASFVDPGGLPDALGAVVDRAKGTGLVVESAVDPGVADLDPVRGLAVLRVAQEGLANAATHAGPSARASLRVTRLGGTVRVEIDDDGAGREPPAARTGHGLLGMRERVELLGGSLTAGPAGPGRPGWRVRATFPEVLT